jgi:CRP-like cAMP-binding protein
MKQTHDSGEPDSYVRTSLSVHRTNKRRFRSEIDSLFYGTETNHLLRPYQDCGLEALPADLERVDVRRGQVVCDIGEPCEHAYFPLSASICYRCVLTDGASLELVRIGCEGFAGWPALTHGVSTPFRTQAATDGLALRCSTGALQGSLDASPAFRQRVLLHFLAVMDEISRTAACIRFHPVNQRICRWLLTASDRASSSQLEMTLTMVADALGVSVGAVSTAVRRLQQCGSVEHSRGVLKLLDRGQLEASACECYRLPHSRPGKPGTQIG